MINIIRYDDDLIRRGDAVDAVDERIRQIGYDNNPLVLSIRQSVRDVPPFDESGTKSSWDTETVAFHSRCPVCGVCVKTPNEVESIFLDRGKLNYCPNCGTRNER